ncbi:hypothetical protein PHLGIDRAFT_115417 [Phlebiopsis gigantea 11061_1 CR5-6]|uniref:Ubiquinone biosynthesis protein n=1 Tax=Phlebiopsis gigantea (strain 11061_1 CR5-6) TaxID=745531 RepID=A0A0C3NYE3_PHLG1|nr:hypothetical protein PHLGIDRAFT_115417 [Phlebiopsis gigantea 11061_1 CR5-6]
MTALRNELLKLALPLVRTHGFTREALSRSALALPTPHPEPLRDTAVSALFGDGDDARRTLISAWLDEGRTHMREASDTSIKDALRTRLRYNEPVLNLLPEAFATLATPPGHILDPRPALKHAAAVADEACVLAGDTSVGTLWHARRASLAAIYTAAELHQLQSPHTADGFLDGLLDSESRVKNTLDDATQYAGYIISSWVGIIKSRGILL